MLTTQTDLRFPRNCRSAARNAARICRDQTMKGMITADKTAALVILDVDPLSMAPRKIRDIKVVETIRQGKTIYRRE